MTTDELVQLHRDWCRIPSEHRATLLRRRGPALEAALRRTIDHANAGHDWPTAVKLATKEAAT